MQESSSRPSDNTVSEQQSVETVFNQLNATFATGKTLDTGWRKSQLTALKRLLEDESDALQDSLYKDLGKSKAESWTSEIGFLLSDIKHTLHCLKRWAKPRKVSTPLVAQPGKSYVIAEPLGTVLVIGAWNYPLQLILAPCIAALAAGNCVLLKPSELAPATSSLIQKLIPRYLDNTAIAVIEGGKDETTDLLALPFDHIFYTGGEAVGKIVMQAASRHLSGITLELGGKSPCLVERSADIAVAARRIVWGKWMNCGQTCVAPDYIVVEACVKDALIAAIIKEIRAQYGKAPMTSADYGKIVNKRHLHRLESYLEGANIISGGQVDHERCVMAPTLVDDPAADSGLMQEEIFGPILPIVTTPQIFDSLVALKARPKPLALYLFTGSREIEEHVIRTVSAGSVCINDTMMFMTNPELPFGGVGNSGIGRYHGKAGFDQLSHLKAVMVRKFWLDVKLRYAPFSSWKLSALKKLL